jgi:hypothetical protein
MADTEVKYRISLAWAGVLIGTALLADVVQIFLSFLHIVPWVGTALALVLTGYVGVTASMIVFPFWLKIQFGVTWFSGKNATIKLMALGFPIIGELVPLINAIPLIVAGVALQVFIARVEDEFFSSLRTKIPAPKATFNQQPQPSHASASSPREATARMKTLDIPHPSVTR